jgi:hypothetical protein
MSISFDGATRLATLSAGTTSLSIRDLWSRWVDWWLTDNNSGIAPLAMVQTGGDDIDLVAGTTIPIYAFLVNGWKIKPQEADHTLNVGDGILLVAGGGDPFVDTVGDYTVRINYQQPVQAITATFVSGSGVTEQDKLDIVSGTWAHVAEAGLSAEDLLRLIAAVLQGNASGLSSDTVAFKSLDGLKNRIEATVADGERTITSRDAT